MRQNIGYSVFLNIGIIVILMFSSLLVKSQSAPVIDNYVDTALQTNITLQNRQYSYEKSLYSLKEAKRLFLPTASVISEFSYNQGGRTIDVPFGDMLNPVYRNLDFINQYNSALNPTNPKFPQYPEISNAVINFLPEKEQRLAVQLMMPILNTAIIYNHKIKKELVEIEKIDVSIYKRELIKEVKIAYINYLMVLELVDLGKTSLELAKENQRVTRSLVENNKLTLNENYNAEAQVKEVENYNLEIDKKLAIAQAYFNFLLNREYNKNIIIEDLPQSTFLFSSIDELIGKAITNRQELMKMDCYESISEKQIGKQKADLIPQIALKGSAGYWSDSYEFSGETDFSTLAFSLKWDIFKSGQRSAKIQQAKIDNLIIKGKRQNIENNISLQIVNAYHEVRTAKESVELAKKELSNYSKSFGIVKKKHAQGLASQLEYDDAFTKYIKAENKFLTLKYKYQQKVIELNWIAGNEI